MIRILLFAVCTWLLAGCGTLPRVPLMLNEKGLEDKVDIEKMGYLVFSPLKNEYTNIKADVTNTNTGEKFRITFTPEFSNSISFGIGPVKVAEKKIEKDMHDKDLVLFQLPPGNYEYKYLFLRKQQAGKKTTGKPFTINKGEILSLGEVSLKGENNFYGQIKSISIKTETRDISDLIKSFSAYEINTLPIRNQILVLESK